VEDDTAFERMMAEISRALFSRLPMTYQVNEISVIEERADGYWKLRAVIPLANN
jgi:hypothetical protein